MGLRCTTVALALGALRLATPASAADKAYGQYLSSECVTCHRDDGQDNGIPSIVGWPADQFLAVLMSYKVKDRPNPVMQAITGRLSLQDMEALALYYNSLPKKIADD